MLNNKLRNEAMDAWAKCLEYDNKIDFAINDLLEKIAGPKYAIYNQDDDPIWTIIGSLTASECRAFISGVDKIVNESGASLQ